MPPNERGPGALAGAHRAGEHVVGQRHSSDTTSSHFEPAWRSRLSVHPAADKFDLLEGDELGSLVADIKKHGIRQPIALMKDGAGWMVVDGRNRLTAAEIAGIDLFMPDGKLIWRHFKTVDGSNDFDPVAYIIGANIHRRHLHLTPAQKRELIAELLKASPERSDRAIAAEAKVSHHTVARVRNDLRDGGQIAHHEKRVGSDGVAQAAQKPRASTFTRYLKEYDQREREKAKPTLPTSAPAPETGPRRMTKEARERVQRDRAAESNALPIRDEAVTREAVRRELRNFIRVLGSLLTRTALIPHPERVERVAEIANLLGVSAADLGGDRR
jgi:hypothetical protein